MGQMIFELATVLFIGLVFGSFATALAWRVPRDIPWIRGRAGQGAVARSACPECGKTLKACDLVPVFSWLFSRGKCRQCAKPIPRRYPLIELATLAACLGIYSVWGFTVPAFIILAAIPFLVALLAIDAEFMILPNQLVLIAGILAACLLLYQYLAYDPAYGFGRQAAFKLAGMVVYAGIVWVAGAAVSVLKKKDALGMGDVKFFAMAGLWMGLTYLPFFLIAAGILGVLNGLYYRLILKKDLFPFGPALILALYAGLVLQGLEIVPLIGVQ